MTRKRKKLDMSLILHVFWNNDASVVENAVFPGCSSLLTAVQQMFKNS
jgi:hypothetical protein